MNLYWGDIHNHNELGYGQGSLDRSYEIARSHLDFYAFTPHAQHPEGNAPNGYPIVNDNWDAIQKAAASYYVPGLFTTFLAYEWHSKTWGHVHCVYEDDLRPLHFANSLAELRETHRDERSILVPHHIAYDQGIDWDLLDPDQSPIVEIFSEHGSSERDAGLHPMLGHSGGPGSVRYTADYGLRNGKRFGFTAGTDNHDGYPGGYGLGLTGVWAEKNTREDVMGAIRARRTIGVTGDRISVKLIVNDIQMGGCVPVGDLEGRFEVTAWDEIAQIELIHDGRMVQTWSPATREVSSNGIYRTRVEYGWGPMKGYHIFDWTGNVTAPNGRIIDAIPCFASDPFDEHRRKDVHLFENGDCSWKSHTSRGGVFTTRNANTAARANDAVCLEIEGGANTELALEMTCHAGNSIVATSVDWGTANHQGHVERKVTIGELLEGRVAVPMGKPSSWIVLHRARPKPSLTVTESFQLKASDPGFAYLRVTQANGQMAWSSPVFFE